MSVSSTSGPLDFQQFNLLEFRLCTPKFRKNLSYVGKVFQLGRSYYSYAHPTLGNYYSLEPHANIGPTYQLMPFQFLLAKNMQDLVNEYHRLRNYDEIRERIAITNPKIGGIANAEPAYPRGGFANAAEYENYVGLYVNKRDHEIPGYLAGLAGAPAFNARDPFAHGHCYLHLLPRDKQAKHYRRGRDYLTRDLLLAMKSDIKRDKVLCYVIRNATTDAHLTLEKDAPANAILITAGELADKLEKAFEDSVVDWDEYQEIYYNTAVTFRA